jgi:hypothetical protein
VISEVDLKAAGAITSGDLVPVVPVSIRFNPVARPGRIIGVNYRMKTPQKWLRINNFYQLNIDDAKGSLGLNLACTGP